MKTGLCPCGTGLRQIRCCGLTASSLPEPDNTALLDTQAQEAVRRFNAKHYADAQALALQLLDLAPNLRPALRVLFEIRKAQNRREAAEVLARRLAALPGTPVQRAAANMQLARYFIGQGGYADAQEPAERAVIATPGDATAHHVLGVVLTETGRLITGERHYRRAIALLPQEDGMLLANLAWNLKLQGRLEQAARLYETALMLRGDNRRGIGGYAQVEFARFNTEKAIATLDAALASWPNDRTLRLLRIYGDLHSGDAESALTRLDDTPGKLLSAERAVRGQALARLGRLAEAVSDYAAVKKMRENAGLRYAPAEIIKTAEACKAYFTSERMLALPRAEPAGPQPVFLLGFAGSGLSLLEQCLAQLPGVAMGGNISSVADLAALMPSLAGPGAPPYPDALDHMLVGEGWDLPEELRARYQQAKSARGLAGAEICLVTDRAPANIWHLGLIKLLFPDAPILHLLRHPLDIMLSNFSQDRKLEADCHVSMQATAKHYALGMNMLKHYRSELTLRYLPLRYEDLVQNIQGEMRRVAEFIGTDCTPAALRVPICIESRYRHSAYQAALPGLFDEVREILAPFISELGYAG
jgi:tetratricopeptide (TPR) repeat protein